MAGVVLSGAGMAGVVFALIVVGLIIGSALISHSGRGPLLWDFPVFGILGFVFAGVLGFGLALDSLGDAADAQLRGHPDQSPQQLRPAAAIAAAPVDVAFVGIGENGHLAFNDPPADFETEEPYIVVGLHEDGRRQQLGEGCFAGDHDVAALAVHRIPAPGEPTQLRHRRVVLQPAK